MSSSKRKKCAIHAPCATRDELAEWVEHHLKVRIPRSPVCDNHHAPMDYLWRAYHEPAQDLVVWAPRGGGKTYLGAIATLLDLLHKPKCSIRILGGSLEQSLRMWEHLNPMVLDLAEKKLVGRQRMRRIELANGSSAAVLTQSQRNVRGQHVQKLRCDEVDMFDPGVWEAAQLVPRSAHGFAGVVEAISTFHRTDGIMQRIIDAPGERKVPILKWCLLEVLERCAPDRPCDGCPLHEDCRGIAHERCEGWVTIDDAIAQKRRVSRDTWESEILCHRPSQRDRVYDRYDETIHLADTIPDRPAAMWLGIDFGYHDAFACLWIAEDDAGRAFVIDEYVQERRVMWQHIQEIGGRRWGKVRLAACDPAGAGVNDQTAQSDVDMLRAAGYDVRTRRSGIVEGIKLIQTALCPADGPVSLFIHPRCARLRAAMKSYRYPDRGGEIPVKDHVHDHPLDALRYWFVNRNASGPVVVRRY